MVKCAACGKTSKKKKGRCETCGAFLDAPQMDPLIGRVVGHFRLEKLIGRGGMGAIYRAIHTVLETVYAVKILHPQFVADPITLERFRREAKAASQLHHENVIFITDFGWQDGIGSYIVMEYLEGYPLSRVLKKKKSYSRHFVLNLFQQIGAGLEAAHAKQIVHRDLKPDNIFLVPQKRGFERVKILDFGIAKVLQDEDAPVVTQEHSALGTPLYMSPEQAACEWGDVDHRTDIYALGVLLYRMLTGKTPIKKGPLREIMYKQSKGELTPLSTYRPDLVGSEMEKVLGWMLEHKREERPASISDLMLHLTPAILELPEAPIGGPLMGGPSSSDSLEAPLFPGEGSSIGRGGLSFKKATDSGSFGGVGMSRESGSLSGSWGDGESQVSLEKPLPSGVWSPRRAGGTFGASDSLQSFPGSGAGPISAPEPDDLEDEMPTGSSNVKFIVIFASCFAILGLAVGFLGRSFWKASKKKAAETLPKVVSVPKRVRPKARPKKPVVRRKQVVVKQNEKVFLRVKSSPKAIVYIGKKKLCQTPCKVWGEKGKSITFWLRQKRYHSKKHTWKAEESDVILLRLKRKRRRRVPPRRRGLFGDVPI